MTGDEIGMEVELATQIDDIAAELNGIAEQLRRKPFAAVEEQLGRQLSRLGKTLRKGQGIECGASPLAGRLLREINGEGYEA